MQASGAWPKPVALPAFSLACPGRDALATDALRGRVLLLVAGGPGTPLPEAVGAGVLLVVLAREEPESRSACASSDPAAWDALAIVTGQAPDKLAGSRVLVDANGWMRAFKARPDAAAWDDPGVFAAAGEAAAAPLAAEGEAHHHR